MYYIEYNSPIGQLTIVSDKNHIIGLFIEGQKYFLNGINDKLIKNDNLEILKLARIWLDDYFEGKKPLISDLALKPKGTVFQMAVWDILTEIPYGQVTTYGEISKRIAQKFNKEKMSAQTVGSAIGHNPISIIIPCHRVVGKNGSLIGYAAGINIKEKLLKFEHNK